MKPLLLLLLLSSSAMAGPIVSVGVGKNIVSHLPFERVIHVGYEIGLTANIFVKPEVGYFLDTQNHAASSYWVGMPLLLEVASPYGTFVRMGFGPSYIKTVDHVQLGSHLEFDIEGGIGMKDKGLSLGLFYKHFSNAGFKQPNMGRDFITIQAQFMGWDK